MLPVKSKVFRVFVVATAWLVAVTASLAQDPPTSQYGATVLLRNLKDPTSIAFRPDGRIYVTLKGGMVKLVNPATKDTSTAGTLPSANVREDGLQSLVLDPNFAANRWVYALTSERSSGDTALVVLRYTADSVTGALQSGTRVTVLKVPYTLNNSSAEHNNGALAFGPDGNLYVALADNTQNIFNGNGAGFAPRDTARPLYDAQRSAANTNDLRGKILRIRPEANGTYSIPAGNLKDSISNLAFNPRWNGAEDDLAKVRPEIFVMGLRHPFRLSVDQKTGWVFWAEPGPNASSDNATQGPRGYEVVSMAKGPGNYGWPYCRANPSVIGKPGAVTTAHYCYAEYNYTSGATGRMFKPDSLRNASKNNTGIRNLPPMRPALIWYPYNSTGTAFPNFGSCSSNCNTAMVGPVYNHSSAQGASRLPAVFDRHIFILEWVRDSLYVARVGDDGSLQNLRIFRKGRDSVMNGAIDMKIGPDGALYFLNWANSGNSGYNYPTNNGGGSLVRYAYTGAHVPVLQAPKNPAGGILRDRLFVAGPGAVVALPEGALGVEVYSLRGERLWRWRAEEAQGRQARLPESIPRGVARLRFLFP